MAKQTINLGTAPSGVGGDDERGAFTKVNANFDELYTAFGGTPPAGSAAAAPIVGTTSAIFQRATNANGDYIRYQDGTQICWGTITVPAQAISTQVTVNATFPIAFANAATSIAVTPLQTAGGTGSQAAIGLQNYNGVWWSCTTTYLQANTYAYRSAVGDGGVKYCYTVIGRWK